MVEGSTPWSPGKPKFDYSWWLINVESAWILFALTARGLPCRPWPAFRMTSVDGRRRVSWSPFVIRQHAVWVESACWSITNGDLGRVAGAETPDRTQNAKFLIRNTRDSHSGLQIGNKTWTWRCSGCDSGPLRGFRESGSTVLPTMIAVCDTQPCTLAPKVHGCVSQTAIMVELCHYDLGI